MSDIAMTPALAAVLADAILVLHALIVGFVLFGQLAILIGWHKRWWWVRWFWLRLTHLITIGFVVLQTWLGELCPLTVWEQQLRTHAGQSAYDASFIEYWLSRVVFYDLPWWAFLVTYTLFGALVVWTWWRLPPLRRNSETT